MSRSELPRPGSTIAGYRIVRLLGEGGIGAVFEAVHVFTERPVALKLLLPRHAASAEARERARKEAVALCRLRHKNVVTVHHADVLPDGTVYIAMELLRGNPLRDVCMTEAPLEVTRALRLAIEIADGLSALHDLKMVHRDVKPENVFLEQQGGVKVLDMNIAKLEVEGMQTTEPGRQFGTTAYLAPEECWAGESTPASDVYRLFLILYELLVGRHVFATGHGLAGLPPEGQLMTAHMLKVPVPAHELERAVPEYAWPVFERGLAKLPEMRFQDGAAAAGALRALLSRYAADVEAGRIVAPTPAPGEPGARRVHHSPWTPPPPVPLPVGIEPRVIVAGAGCAEPAPRVSGDAAPGAGSAGEGAGSEAAMARTEELSPAEPSEPSEPRLEPGEPPPVAADPSRKGTVTPAPVVVPSRPGSGPGVGPGSAPATQRVALKQRRERLLRRAAAAAALAIPVSAAITGIYVHFGRQSEASGVSAAAAPSDAKPAPPEGSTGASARPTSLPAPATPAGQTETPAPVAQPEAAAAAAHPGTTTPPTPAPARPQPATAIRDGSVPARPSRPPAPRAPAQPAVATAEPPPPAPAPPAPAQPAGPPRPF